MGRHRPLPRAFAADLRRQDITTPLLILHSENDLRCPIEQGEQLFVALKLRREVEFVRFPDENHEMSRSGKPRHRLERFRHHPRVVRPLDAEEAALETVRTLGEFADLRPHFLCNRGLVTPGKLKSPATNDL